MNSIWRYLSVTKKTKFVRSVFGRIYGATICLRFFIYLYHCTNLFLGQQNTSYVNEIQTDIILLLIKIYLIPSVWSWILVELELDRSLVVFGEEGSAKRTIVWRTIGPNGKNPLKIRSKNSWNWLIILIAWNSLTNFEYVVHTMTGNGSYLNLQSFAGKKLVKPLLLYRHSSFNTVLL